MIDYKVVYSSEMIVIKAGNGQYPVGCVHLDRRTHEIFGLLVNTGYQRMGIGTRLIKMAEKEAKNLGIVKVWGCVTLSNVPSLTLFMKNKYKRMVYFEKEIK